MPLEGYLPLTLHKPGRLFRKLSRKLPEHIKENINEVVIELATKTELAPGRHPELIIGYDYTYSIRLSRGYRIAIEITGTNQGRFVYVGTHERFYSYMNRP